MGFVTSLNQATLLPLHTLWDSRFDVLATASSSYRSSQNCFPSSDPLLIEMTGESKLPHGGVKRLRSQLLSAAV